MYKATAIFLAFCLLGLSGFYLGAFWLAKTQIRQEVKKQIQESVPPNELVKFIFSAEELKQVYFVKPHEFRYLGRLYDIVKTELQNGKTVLFCINDIQEEKLFAKLDEMVSLQLVQNGQSRALQKGFVKVLLEKYFGQQSLALIKSGIDNSAALFFNNQLDICTGFVVKCLKPPKN